MSANDRPAGWARSSKPRSQPAGRPARRWLLPALVLGGLAGVIAGLMFLPGRNAGPVVLAVAVTEYAPDWPPNPFAREDAQGLCQPFAADAAVAFQSQTKPLIQEKLREAVKAAGRRPAVVYLSALGTVTADTAYLLPDDAKPDREAGWLTLDDVLTPLQEASGPVLLVLDVRPVAAVRAVLPTGDVNEKLEADLAARERDGRLPLTVLHANTPRGGPVILRPLKRTAFGLAVAQAVGGAADGWGPAGNTGDGLVTASEFTAYVRAVTHAATRAAGGELQTPTVHGKAADFPLLPVPKAVELVPTTPDPPDEDKYPNALTEAWKEAARAERGGLSRRAPRLVQSFFNSAVLAERRWLAGRGADAVAQTLNPKPDAFTQTVNTFGPVRPSLVSVARHCRLATLDSPDAKVPNLTEHGKRAEAVFRAAMAAIRNPNPEKKGELTEALAKVREDKTDPPLPFDVVAAHLLDVAARLEKPTQEQFRQLLEAAKAHPSADKPHPPVAELAALDLIAGVSADQYAKWGRDAAGAVAALLDTTLAAERAAAFDGRFFPWVKADLTAADDARREAMVALCKPNTPTATLTGTPDQLNTAARLYAQAETRLAQLTAAQFEVEEARAVVDDLGTFGPPDPGANAEIWASAIPDTADAVRKLTDLLRRPPADGAAFPGDDLSRLTNLLKVTRIAALTRINPTAADRDPERYLRWPRWTPKDRQELHKRFRDKSDAATARVLAAWPKQPLSDPPAVGPPAATAAVPPESVQALRVAAALFELQRHGHSDARDAAELRGKVRDAGSKLGADAKAFSDLARTVLAARRKATAEDAAAGDAARTPELLAHRAAEKEFAGWLATHRCGKDADAIDPYFPAGPSPAARWRQVADALRKP